MSTTQTAKRSHVHKGVMTTLGLTHPNLANYQNEDNESPFLILTYDDTVEHLMVRLQQNHAPKYNLAVGSDERFILLQIPVDESLVERFFDSFMKSHKETSILDFVNWCGTIEQNKLVDYLKR